MSNARRNGRRHTDVGGGATWEYAATAAETIAAQARAGELVYSPPPSTTSVRPRSAAAAPSLRDPENQRRQPPPPKPPDLASLRAALVARGLDLEDQGAFYHRVIKRSPISRITRGAGS